MYTFPNSWTSTPGFSRILGGHQTGKQTSKPARKRGR